MEKAPRPEKVAAVTEVRERLEASNAAILTEYRGLSVAKLADLRSKLRDVGGEFTVYKNTLVRFAVRDLGIEIEDLLTGPTAIAFVGPKPDGEIGDAVDVAKVLKDFGKENPALVLKGSVLRGQILDVAQTNALAEVEPRDVLLAKLAGGLAAPMVKFAGLLQALPRNFAYGLKALIEKNGGAPDSPDDDAPTGGGDDAPTAETDAETTEEAAAAAPTAEASTETPATETPDESAAESPAASADTTHEETQES